MSKFRVLSSTKISASFPKVWKKVFILRPSSPSFWFSSHKPQKPMKLGVLSVWHCFHLELFYIVLQRNYTAFSVLLRSLRSTFYWRFLRPSLWTRRSLGFMAIIDRRKLPLELNDISFRRILLCSGGVCLCSRIPTAILDYFSLQLRKFCMFRLVLWTKQ